MVKRILFVGPYPPPYGGIASHLASLAPLFVKSGYEVFSINNSLKDEEWSLAEIKKSEFTISRIARNSMFPVFRNLFRSNMMYQGFTFRDALKYSAFSHGIYRYLNNTNIDAIFFYGIFRSFAIPILKEIYGVNVPMSVMNFGEGFEKRSYYEAKGSYLKLIAGHSKFLFASSDYCAGSARSLYGNEKDIGTIYIGVQISRFRDKECGNALRKELGIPQESVLCTFLGRMIEDMGLDVVIDIIPEILKQKPDAVFLLAGAKGMLSDAAEKASAGNGSVFFFPDVPADKLPALYAATDIFLAPTRDNHACMGVSIKEAMVSSLPVIATDTCGIPEAVVNGETGMLVPLNGRRADKRSMIDATLEVIDNKDKRILLGKNGYERACKLFDEKVTFDKYLDMIESM